MSEQEHWYTNEPRRLLLKERYFTGSHNYFFEVKEAKNGSKYVIVDQRKKVGNKFVGSKIRIFEDEMLEFQRVLQKLIDFALANKTPTESTLDRQENESRYPDKDLSPSFFEKLHKTGDWQEFEKYTYYLLKLLGVEAAYNFLGERQAGKADGFFKFGSLAVIYDCTLEKSSFEDSKREQINNYCNRLKQGSIQVFENTTEEFYNHHKQVWIITRGVTRRIKIVNTIEVKEISIQDLTGLYQERLTTTMNNQTLETKLRNL